MRSCWSLALLCCLTASGCAIDESSAPDETGPSASELRAAVELIPPPNFYSYSAGNTNSAQQNTVNQLVVLNDRP